MQTQDVQIGAYRGCLVTAYYTDAFVCWLANLSDFKPGELIVDGRHRLYRLSYVRDEGSILLAVKAFGRQRWLKDRIDVDRGSKARRSWLAAVALAQAGVGTPTPIGYLDRWENGRLVESYLLTLFEDGMVSFKDELIRLFHQHGPCSSLMPLLQTVAESVRAMHDAGVLHRDLGNQNILLRRDGEARWKDVKFIDLNRSRMLTSLNAKQRGRDISRIYLPSDLRRVFLEMYYAPGPPPPPFLTEERFRRRLFAWHTATRKYRHPLRARRQQQRGDVRRSYPPEQDLWIWDDRSIQAVPALRSRDRHKYYAWSNHVFIGLAAARAWLPARIRSRRLLRTAYHEPVVLQHRVGITVTGALETLDRELALLKELGPLPVLVRFYHHHLQQEWDDTVAAVRRLKAHGYTVSIALVQDRRAILEKGRWDYFIRYVLKAVGCDVDWVEVGHAINRVKWGIWRLAEYRELIQAVHQARTDYPDIKIMGPAVIDFEWHYVAAALRALPKGFRWNGLSHHLYVDRRGAPENRQGAYDTLGKCAMIRALAGKQVRPDGAFIISETNWPLKGTGVYSPVVSPYDSPGLRTRDPSVSETDYGNYMIRYLLITLCSGLVDRVYWWRLAAHGFGLVDDLDPAGWRLRPAYCMLKEFLERVGSLTFYKKEELPDEVQLYRFRNEAGNAETAVIYTLRREVTLTLPSGFERACDATGQPIDTADGKLILTGSPVYLEGIS